MIENPVMQAVRYHTASVINCFSVAGMVASTPDGLVGFLGRFVNQLETDAIKGVFPADQAEHLNVLYALAGAYFVRRVVAGAKHVHLTVFVEGMPFDVPCPARDHLERTVEFLQEAFQADCRLFLSTHEDLDDWCVLDRTGVMFSETTGLYGILGALKSGVLLRDHPLHHVNWAQKCEVQLILCDGFARCADLTRHPSEGLDVQVMVAILQGASRVQVPRERYPNLFEHPENPLWSQVGAFLLQLSQDCGVKIEPMM